MIRPGHQVSTKMKPFGDLEISPRNRVILSHGGEYDGDAVDPYATDHFRMYEFKVRKCTRSRNHDWTDCPFLHPGEKARRRDPRRFTYCATVCSDFRRGSCPRGDDCEFAHGVFECWLHPTRYRTEACKDGESCTRKVCFFAHSPEELRTTPDPTSFLPAGSTSCKFCCSAVALSSPTSTLLDYSRFSRSPSVSPPMSPVYVDDYEELLVKKMMSCLEGMRLANDGECSGACRSRNVPKHEYGSGLGDPDMEWVKELLE